MSEHGRALNEGEQRLFSQFFASLKQASIPFLLLRNYEDFPQRIGHDIDLFFQRQDALKVKDIFLKLLSSAGGNVIVIHERGYFIDIRFVLGLKPADAIHLDIYHGSFTWHGLTYLRDEELLSAARQYNGYPIPRPAHEAYNIFFASILWGGFYKSRYQPRIAALLSAPEERAEFDRCIRKTFGDAGIPPFDPCSPVIPDKGIVRQYARKLRRVFKMRSLSRNPLRTASGLARHWSVELGCFLRPKGLVVAITGPDEKQLLKICEGLTHQLGELFGENQTYHLEGASGQNSIGSFRQWLKCWFRWPVRRWKKKGQSHLVILDRHTEDWWCNPSRYGFSRLPDGLLKMLAGLTPKPDFTFFILRTGEKEPLLRYESWAKNHRNCVIVDGNQPEPAILDCIESQLVAYLREREASF